MDGSSVREHLQAAHRATGRLPAAIANAPALPDGCAMLWHDFIELRSMARGMGMGPVRISYNDIDAYCRVNSVRFAPWELKAIRLADGAYLAAQSKDGDK